MDSIFFSIAVFIHFAVLVAVALFMWRIHRLWSTNFFGPYSKEDKFWNWYTYTAAGLVPDNQTQQERHTGSIRRQKGAFPSCLFRVFVFVLAVQGIDQQTPGGVDFVWRTKQSFGVRQVFDVVFVKFPIIGKFFSNLRSFDAFLNP